MRRLQWYKRGAAYDRHKKDWNLFSMVKNGLKAQKLLAQGIALGIIAISKAPCKGKSFMFRLEF